MAHLVDVLGRTRGRRSVNLGLYFDLRNPPPWARDPAWLYGFTLEMCEEADRLGVHSIWLTEHHGFEDGYLPQPLTFAAAVAARTRTCRIGTAVVLAPIRAARHLAEEAAVIDLLSGGRFDLGLGAGYRGPEFTMFGAAVADRYDVTASRVRDVRAAWADPTVTPTPTGDDVPMWLGFTGPRGAALAGELGTGLLSADPRLWQPYRDAHVAAGRSIDDARMAGHIQAWVSTDPERDWPRVRPHLAWQLDSYRQYAAEGTGQVPTPIDVDALRSRRSHSQLGYFYFGTPAEVARDIEGHTDGAPVETVFAFASLAGTEPDLVAEHIRTLVTDLAPRLALPT
jgi:alkanesulfonate monooxygenase SsuD/methylene tetrahydromethanopterin reductase-like flavin-dependent oxidoreductase (luciferase family)